MPVRNNNFARALSFVSQSSSGIIEHFSITGSGTVGTKINQTVI
jgi:hypothetical protein